MSQFDRVTSKDSLIVIFLLTAGLPNWATNQGNGPSMSKKEDYRCTCHYGFGAFALYDKEQTAYW